MHKYPEKLVEYLTECEAEGYEIFTNHSEDNVVWIIKTTLEKWYVLISWYEGTESYQLINLTGKAAERMFKLFKEDGYV